jgi:hypothetical protein
MKTRRDENSRVWRFLRAKVKPGGLGCVSAILTQSFELAKAIDDRSRNARATPKPRVHLPQKAESQAKSSRRP